MLASARRRMRDDLQHMRDKTVELELKMDRVSRQNSTVLLPCSDRLTDMHTLVAVLPACGCGRKFGQAPFWCCCVCARVCAGGE